MAKNNTRKEVILFDTTLRDGHQCPGAAIERDEDYFNVVRGLDRIGFDICEVGFPASSQHEQWRVQEVAKMNVNGEISTMVCALTQMVDFQVDACLEALEPAMSVKKAMFHIYFPVDPRLQKASIGNKISNTQAIEDVARFTKMAHDMGAIIQFSPEGYSRVDTNFDFCTDLLVAAAENGATYFNMPDTIGGADPLSDNQEYYVKTIQRHKKILDEQFPNNDFIWSVHNHNDLGNAVENSIRGALPGTGIKKIEGTINGIGERAGNADLNQIITRMKTTLSNQFNIDHISSEQLWEVSQLVSSLMLPVQPNYPIVGENAMKHTSGGHANAIMKDPTVYQPFSPELVGREVSLTYGPNSGGNLARDIISNHGYKCDYNEKRKLDRFLKRKMQELGRYKGLTDREVIELYKEFKGPIKIQDYGKQKSARGMQITFEGSIFGEDNVKVYGNTAFSALKDFISEKIPGYGIENYTSISDTTGTNAEAIAEVKVIDKQTNKSVTGKGEDLDLQTAALKALANAFNKIYVEKHFRLKIDSHK